MFLTHVRNLVTLESDGTFDPFSTFSTFQSAESRESRPGRKPDVDHISAISWRIPFNIGSSESSFQAYSRRVNHLAPCGLDPTCNDKAESHHMFFLSYLPHFSTVLLQSCII